MTTCDQIAACLPRLPATFTASDLAAVLGISCNSAGGLLRRHRVDLGLTPMLGLKSITYRNPTGWTDLPLAAALGYRLPDRRTRGRVVSFDSLEDRLSVAA